MTTLTPSTTADPARPTARYRCEWSTCRRPATHGVRESLPLHGAEDLCSSHVAPAMRSELKYLTAESVTVVIL